MENFKKLLEQSGVNLHSSSDESDLDNDLLSSYYSRNNKVSLENTLEVIPDNFNCKNSKRNGKRLPTRIPNPNVYNRNALLARENRKKKKLYLETIEKELEEARKANQALVKAFKRQVKIAQRLQKEKKYLENIVTNRSDLLTVVNPLTFRQNLEYENSSFSIRSNREYINNDARDITNTRSLESSPNDTDALLIEFDNPSDGSINAPIEGSMCDYSSYISTFPEFFTDLDNETDTSLPSTTSTLNDIWDYKNYYVDNLTSTNYTILQNNNELYSFNEDHCYWNTGIGTLQQRSESSDDMDVKGCTHIGNFCSTSNFNPNCRTPPLQLLSEQSS